MRPFSAVTSSAPRFLSPSSSAGSDVIFFSISASCAAAVARISAAATRSWRICVLRDARYAAIGVFRKYTRTPARIAKFASLATIDMTPPPSPSAAAA
jgi:hypothetical protein